MSPFNTPVRPRNCEQPWAKAGEKRSGGGLLRVLPADAKGVDVESGALPPGYSPFYLLDQELKHNVALITGDGSILSRAAFVGLARGGPVITGCDRERPGGATLTDAVVHANHGG